MWLPQVEKLFAAFSSHWLSLREAPGIRGMSHSPTQMSIPATGTCGSQPQRRPEGLCFSTGLLQREHALHQKSMASNENSRRKFNTSTKMSLVQQSLSTLFLPGDKKQWGKQSKQGLEREKSNNYRIWKLERGKNSNKKRIRYPTVQQCRLLSGEGQQAPYLEAQLKVMKTLGSSFTNFDSLAFVFSTHSTESISQEVHFFKQAHKTSTYN